MKTIYNNKVAAAAAILLLAGSVLLGGCSNINPVEPRPPYTLPPAPPTEAKDVKVTYNYNATDKVQLSANNIVLKVGQKLILEPARGLTTNTRFTSSGEYFFADVMKQEGNAQANGKAIFIAEKPGKGKLQIIPNTNDTSRAIDFWVTVQ
jgi:PBP1b-binding outer membrane lipoprotein LpoB